MLDKNIKLGIHLKHRRILKKNRLKNRLRKRCDLKGVVSAGKTF
jgi:hypothetical protein